MTTLGDRVTLYLRNVPAHLVRQAKVKAAREGRTLTAVAIEALARGLQTEAGAPAADQGEEELRDATAWYEANRRELVRKYPGEYVAIVEGEVLDHDSDFEALATRIFDRLGPRSVFMPRVSEAPERAHMRSPRRRVS